MSQIDVESLGRRIIGHPLVLLIVGVVMQILAVIALGYLLRAVLTPLGHNTATNLAADCIAATFAIVTYWLFVRFVERAPMTDLAMPGAAREWGWGVAIGVGAMAATIGVIALLGGYRITGSNAATVLIPIAGMAIQSGVMEEILLRGLIFRLLEKWLGSWAALLISALLFGLGHIANPNSSLFAALAIALEAGILLAAVYMVTRRLWAAIGLHMAWNFTQGGIFGVAVSGNAEQGLLQNVMEGPELLTGGAFGAEASIPAIIICTGIGLACLYLAWKRGHFVSMSWARFKTGRDAPQS